MLQFLCDPAGGALTWQAAQLVYKIDGSSCNTNQITSPYNIVLGFPLLKTEYYNSVGQRSGSIGIFEQKILLKFKFYSSHLNFVFGSEQKSGVYQNQTRTL